MICIGELCGDGISAQGLASVKNSHCGICC